MDTIDKVLNQTAEGKDFDLLLGDFLDEFYRSELQTKSSMLNEVPSGRSFENSREKLAFAAASAHKLANDFHLTPPSWVFEKSFYSEMPYFGCHAKGNLRLLFMYTSPPEFKHRNLFVDANVLVRV